MSLSDVEPRQRTRPSQSATHTRSSVALLTKIRLMTDFRYLLIALAVSRLFFARRRLRTSRWHCALDDAAFRSEEHTSELQSLMRISYAVFCVKKKKKTEQII